MSIDAGTIAAKLVGVSHAKRAIGEAILAKGGGLSCYGDSAYPTTVPGQVEYIESTGTQWIDTGITPVAATFGFEGRFTVLQTGTEAAGFMGCRYSNTARRYNIFYQNNGLRIDIIGTTGITYAVKQGNILTLKLTSDKMYCGVNRYSRTLEADGTNHFYLFNMLDNTAPFSTAAKQRLHWLKIYNGSTTVRDYVPVVKDGVACLYDKISQTYFYNGGTGNFIAGPVVAGKPYDAELEWIESIPNCGTSTSTANNGGNVFFCDIFAGPNTSFEMKGMAMLQERIDAYGVTNARVAGSCKWGNDQTFSGTRVYFGADINATGWSRSRACLGYSDATYKAENIGIYYADVPNRHTSTQMLHNGDRKVDTGAMDPDYYNVEYDCQFGLLGCPINTSAWNYGTNIQSYACRFYYCKIWESGVLVKDIVPVRKGTTICFYDRVSNQVYYNEGVGVLEAGPEANNLPLQTPSKFSDYGKAIQNIKSSGGWNDYDWTDEEATWCVFINLDGGIEHLYTKQEVQAAGFKLPPVPLQPLHNDPLLGDALINGTWNWTLAEIQAATHPMVVGPCYDTKDFKTWFVVDIPTNGYVLHMYPPQNGGDYNIDWGDGNTWSVSTANPGTVTHTYTTAGRYIIKWYRTNGNWSMQIGYGNTPVSGPYDNADTFKDQQLYKYIFTMSSNNLGLNSVVNMLNLRYLVYRTTGLAQAQARGRFLSSLKAIAYPRGLTYLLEGGSYDQGNPSPSLVAISLPATANYNTEGCRGTNPVVIRPQVFRTWDGSTTYNLSQSYRDNMWSLKYDHVPGPYKPINAYLFRNCYQLEKVEWDDYMANVTFTTIGVQAFDTCRCLRELENCNMSEVTTIGTAAFRYCHALWQSQDVSFPKCTRIGSESFRNMPMRSLTFGTTGTTTTIPIDNGTNLPDCRNLVYICFHGHVSNMRANMLGGCRSLTTVDLRECTSVPTLDNVNCFANTPSLQQIIVPDSLYTSWKAAANWSSTTNNIVNRIVKASEAQPYS